MVESALETRATDIERAAAFVAESALSLCAGERLMLFADAGSMSIASALAEVANALGADTMIIDLDQLGPRPLVVLDDELVRALGACHASAFVASAPHRELTLRQHVLHTVREKQLRHAHMPGISQLAFTRGMRIDYSAVRRAGQRLLHKLPGARSLELSGPHGTSLTLTLAPTARWFAQLGELSPGRWGNLPAGAIYTSPSSVNGVFVANASLGEYFGQRAGKLERAPVRFLIEDGWVRRVYARSLGLKAEIEKTLAISENSRRVGLIAIGVNSGIGEATGEALVDQNLPGLHLAFGDPAARVTGADWSAPTSFAACQCGGTLVADGATLVLRGQLLDVV